MLVLTRRTGQAIRVGPNVEVRVVRIEGDRVVLGIVAPRHIAVVRSELVEQVSGEILEASDARAKLRVMIRPIPVPGASDASASPAGEPSSPDDPGAA